MSGNYQRGFRPPKLTYVMPPPPPSPVAVRETRAEAWARIEEVTRKAEEAIRKVRG
jgi:hypothetical protein